MNAHFSRIKSFITSKLRGRLDGDSNNHVKWQAVDQQDAFEEPEPPKPPAASFPGEGDLELGPSTPLRMTQKDEGGEGRSPQLRPESSSSGSNLDLDVCQVRIDVHNPPARPASVMSTATLFPFGMDSLSSGSASSHERVADQPATPPVQGVENILYDIPDMKNSNRQSSSVNSELSSWSTQDGSQTNLGFTDNESEGSSASSGWMWQKNKNEASPTFGRHSKSFIDKTRRFVRRGRERLSLIELNRSRNSVTDGPRQPRFMRLTEWDGKAEEQPSRQFVRGMQDRSSASSRISLPQRPSSGMFTGSAAGGFSRRSLRSVKTPSSSSPASRPRSALDQFADDRSLRTSGGYDDYIDWSWLDDAVADLNEQALNEDQVRPQEERDSQVAHSQLTSVVTEALARPVTSSRADAQCQTHSDPSWEEERLRLRELGPPHSASSRSSAACEPAPPTPAGHAMLRKPADDAGPSAAGPSGPALSSWLRASMRRVTHFNLDPPSDRPASAPAGRTPPQPPPPSPPLPGADTPDSLGYVSDSTDRQTSAGQRSNGLVAREPWEGRSPLGPWPHGLSSVLALLGCTLGLFNISRFAVLSVHFGANFIIQFVLLSLVLGIPLFAFHTALGQTLGAGPIDMWSISPVFQGIGIALLLAQALVGIYSVVGVSWMFVYFRDSFITKQDTYRWAEPFKLYREDAGEIPGQFINSSLGRLDQTVPDYLNGVVLQRHGLASPASSFGNLKFQLTFNLAVIWMVVFVSLSKGLRSYGKVVYVFSLVPVLGIFVLSSKLLGLTPMRHGLFPHTDWTDFFFNTKSWVSAATEVTLTWNLLGAAAMQVTSHNRSSKRLWRDVAVVALITLFVLILAAFLANTCHQILSLKYSYIPSSFEGMNSYTFLRPMGAPLPPHYATPLRALPHASLVAGDRVGRPGAVQESGYQVVRLATELMPATLALLGADLLSPFWAVLFYFTLILFGIAQQLAIWHCVITGVLAINTKALKSWETTITFFACAAGFVLGLPMTTELGVFVVYFLDYCVGGGWWVLVVTLMELIAVFMIRGSPYTGEYIANALFGKKSSCLTCWAVPLLTFAWNVVHRVMPVAVLGVCISVFRTGGYRDMWVWRSAGRAGYWPHWARQVGMLLQLVPLLCVPVVAIIQTYRYLSTGPPDILDRLANLFRPSPDASRPSTAESATSEAGAGNAATTAADVPPSEDPPPKYTPPPSYSTATGARIAKMLRQSFRRSVRRLQGALEPQHHQQQQQQQQEVPMPPPPDYSSVLVEMNDDFPHPYTAADVANVLRSSFRRAPITRTTSTAPTSLTTLSPTHSSAQLQCGASSTAPTSLTTLSPTHSSAQLQCGASSTAPASLTTLSPTHSPSQLQCGAISAPTSLSTLATSSSMGLSHLAGTMTSPCHNIAGVVTSASMSPCNLGGTMTSSVSCVMALCAGSVASSVSCVMSPATTSSSLNSP